MMERTIMFRQGMQAFNSDRPRTHCPYGATENRNEWFAGWDYACLAAIAADQPMSKAERAKHIAGHLEDANDPT